MTSTNPPGVQRFLDASTGHITREDNELLRAWAKLEPEESTHSSPYRTIAHAYGYFVHVHLLRPSERREYEREARRQGISEAFLRLQEYARKHSCWWINLDRDADTIDSLPTHEW
jgi:hypothetical protein